MMPVSILSNLLTKGVSVSSECVCEHPTSITELNRVQLMKGIFFCKCSSWKKMKEWNENSRMWGPYELCVTEVSSSGKVCSWPKDRPPRTKCAATRISETAPANYITELQKFCQHLPDQMELSFSYCVCVTRNMENGIFQISSTASQLGPVGTSDINWESLLTG